MNAFADDHEPNESCFTCSSWWRLPLLFGIVLVAVIALRGGVRRGVTEGGQSREAPTNDGAAKDGATNAAEPTGKTVLLSIDFGDGDPLSDWAVAWHHGMTVADVLAAGKLQYSRQGSGVMTFLTEIDGVSNEGAGGHNWTYSVNGKKADRSYAVYELRPGDRILWSFAAPE